LVQAFHARGLEVAVETNGTKDPPQGLDWVCVSPKGRQPLRVLAGHELKLVFPQVDNDPEDFEHLGFLHRFLQPMDGPRLSENLSKAVEYCLEHPQWRLSLQTHKVIGIP
jgi:organic radical activating enzyme